MATGSSVAAVSRKRKGAARRSFRWDRKKRALPFRLSALLSRRAALTELLLRTDPTGTKDSHDSTHPAGDSAGDGFGGAGRRVFFGVRTGRFRRWGRVEQQRRSR
jgi:hypothetical protein